jgi:hypothetical protein
MQPSWLQTYAQRLLHVFGVGVLVGLPFGLLVGLPWLLAGLSIWLLAGLLAGLLAYSRDIKTFEVLKWRWKKGLLAGLLFVLLFGLLFVPLEEWLRLGLPVVPLEERLLVGLFYALPFGLLVVLLVGLGSEEIQTKTVPNQGIRQSAKNAVILGLLVVLLFGLLFVPPFGLSFRLLVGLPIWLLVGLPIGLSFGGLAFIQHYFLRVIIYRSGYIPWNYARFLDYATERIFLRKVGGGYIFVHRLLMDYFASLEPE